MADPRNPSQFVPMHYDAERTAGAQPEVMVTQQGEERPALEVLTEAYSNPALKGLLKPAEISRVEEYLKGNVHVHEDRDSEKESMRQELAELKAMVLSLTKGKVAEPDEDIVEDEVEEHSGKAACGKEFTKRTVQGVSGSIRFHEMKCKACEAAKKV